MIYLNGDFLPIEEARISVLDRGFIFGDGVYEVIPVYSRKPFRLAEHLLRLQHSLDGIRLQNPHSTGEWSGMLEQVIARNERSEEHTSELQSPCNLVCRLLLEKKKKRRQQ